jgi:hypothetical protein
MKVKLSTMIAAAAVATSGFAPAALAYHDGGVAYCEGCHTMHNSVKGVAVNPSAPVDTGVAYLLKGTDQGSTCLNCHASTAAKAGGYHVMTYPVPAVGAPVANFGPGGDFAWLQKGSYATPAGSHSTPALKQRHGHNIIAIDYGLQADPDLSVAPGGTYSNQNLTCISCHDPHQNARITDAAGTIGHTVTGGTTGIVFGKTLPIGGSGSYGALPDSNQAVGVYRLLAGLGYAPKSYPAAVPFVSDSPIAVAPSTYNNGGTGEATADVRVAYGKGMSEWCANCHTNIHSTAADGTSAPFIHPAGVNALLTASANVGGFSTTNQAIYNAYKSSGDLSGTSATSYTSLVPYEEGTGSLATLAGHANNNGSYTAGPTGTSENVMCLSCHRAHASGFGSMTRWSPDNEFITIASQWPGVDATNSDAAEAIAYSSGMSQAEYASAMYNHNPANLAYKQRVLCNKCHAKD